MIIFRGSYNLTIEKIGPSLTNIFMGSFFKEPLGSPTQWDVMICGMVWLLFFNLKF